jgi:sugar lactone lactonase YvrE
VSALLAPVACELPCTLGEGLLWEARGQRWCWTDIEQACIYTWAGPGHAPARRAVPDRVGSFTIARSGRWLLGLAKGLAWADWDGDTLAQAPLSGSLFACCTSGCTGLPDSLFDDTEQEPP